MASFVIQVGEDKELRYIKYGTYNNYTTYVKAINTASRFDTESGARTTIANIIKKLDRIISEYEGSLKVYTSTPAKRSTSYYLKKFYKEKTKIEKAQIVPFQGTVTQKANLKNRVRISKAEPFKHHCQCCGFIIPTRNFLYSSGGYRGTDFRVCPICVTKFAEIAKEEVASFAREEPELYEKMMTEMLLSDL